MRIALLLAAFLMSLNMVHAQDTDNDGLFDTEEVNDYLTDPSLPDTDDDTVNDGNEVFDGTNPLFSLNPFQERAIRFLPGGVGRVTFADIVPPSALPRFNMQIFTLECFVNPSNFPAANVDQPLISRVAASNATIRTSYELGLRGDKPYVKFQSLGGFTVEVVSGLAVPLGQWSHLAGRFDGSMLTIFVDGLAVGSVNTALKPMQGVGDLVLGGGTFDFVGDLREVRLWLVPRSDAEIAATRFKSLYVNSTAVTPGVLQTDGIGLSHFRNNKPDGSDNLLEWTIETWVRTTDTDGGTLVAHWNTGSAEGTEDFNYKIMIQPDGRVRGGFAIEYLLVSDPGTDDESVEVVVNQDANDLLGVIPINDGEWHHVAYVRNALGAFLYVDGRLESQQAPLLIPLPGPGQIILGEQVRILGGPLVVGFQTQGQFDETRIWGEAKSQTEIRVLKSQNLSGNEANLVTYFNYDNYRGGLEVINRPALFTVPITTNTDYGLIVPNASILTDTLIPCCDQTFRLEPFRVLNGVELRSYMPTDDGGTTVEDFSNEGNAAYAGVFNAFAQFVTLGTSVGFDDSDGDGLPDSWETANGLDPQSSQGVNGAWGDPDGDGLSNSGEYQAGTDPRDIDSDNDGINDYDDKNAQGLVLGLLYDDGDGIPGTWEEQYPGAVDPLVYDAKSDTDGDGWSALSEFLFKRPNSTQQSTSPANEQDYPTPSIGFDIMYTGVRKTGNIIIEVYNNKSMDGGAEATFVYTPSNFFNQATYRTNVTATGYLKEGDTWFFAFWDNDSSGTWSDGEPAGVAYDQPYRLGPGDLNGVPLCLTDSAPGYPRFSWTGVSNGVSSATTVTITRTTSSGAPIVFRKLISERTFFHEGDLIEADILGLPSGQSRIPGYQWIAGGSSGIFAFDWTQALSKPQIVSPNGAVLNFSRNKMRWRMDASATRVQVQIMRNNPSSAPIYDIDMIAAPCRMSDGSYSMDFPVYVGRDALLTNGVYFWRVRAKNPAWTSEYSDAAPFNVSVTTSGSGVYHISGNIQYNGAVTIGRYIVQAFSSRGFSGEPIAQISQASKGAFSLAGIPAGTYYVRGFLDMNNNGTLEEFEPYGVMKVNGSYSADYTPREYLLPQSEVGQILLLRDRDADNDGFSDAFVYQYGLVPYLYDPFDGDLGNSVAVYHPNTGNWFVERTGGFYGGQIRQFGWSAAVPVPGDYDGDGKRDPAVYHQAAGEWYVLRSSTGTLLKRQYGWNQAIPVPADYDGDGKTDFAVYHPQSGTWYILQSASGQQRVTQYGWSAAQPVPADYDGDGKTDIALYFAPLGNWYILQSASGVPVIRQFGFGGTLPVPADYDGDFRADLAVYHPPAGQWYILNSATASLITPQWGFAEARPVPADYNNDNRDDIAVFHPATGQWSIRYTGGGSRFVTWGWSETVPVTSDTGLFLNRRP